MTTLGIVLVVILVIVLLGGVGGPYVHPGMPARVWLRLGWYRHYREVLVIILLIAALSGRL